MIITFHRLLRRIRIVMIGDEDNYRSSDHSWKEGGGEEFDLDMRNNETICLPHTRRQRFDCENIPVTQQA